jgi:hypothetical protein
MPIPAQSERRFRICIFCGGRTSVLVVADQRPEDAELDADAEFASAGRSFSDVEDGDPIGVGCYPCSRKQWAKEGS